MVEMPTSASEKEENTGDLVVDSMRFTAVVQQRTNSSTRRYHTRIGSSTKAIVPCVLSSTEKTVKSSMLAPRRAWRGAPSGPRARGGCR